MPNDPLAGYNLTPEERERMMAHVNAGGMVGTWKRGDRPPSRTHWGSQMNWYDMSPEEQRALGLASLDAHKDADYWWKRNWRANTAAGRADRSRWAGEPTAPPEGGWGAPSPYGADGTIGGLMRATPQITPAPASQVFNWGRRGGRGSLADLMKA